VRLAPVPHLSVSPGRILANPANSADHGPFANTRKPLVGVFRYNGPLQAAAVGASRVIHARRRISSADGHTSRSSAVSVMESTPMSARNSPSSHGPQTNCTCYDGFAADKWNRHTR
jgi:hypothetical protein